MPYWAYDGYILDKPDAYYYPPTSYIKIFDADLPLSPVINSENDDERDNMSESSENKMRIQELVTLSVQLS